MQRHDVVIVGGAIVGSAVAYFRKVIDPACDVAVVRCPRLRARAGAQG